MTNEELHERLSREIEDVSQELFFCIRSLYDALGVKFPLEAFEEFVRSREALV